MKVSIITTTYNSAATVKDTIVSVLSQTYKNIEHIVIDGRSKDNTINIIRENGHSGPVISEHDHGIYDAMNKGLSLATGDIVGILNSDDFYSNNEVIEKVVSVFSKSNVKALYGDLDYVDPYDTSIVRRRWIAGGYRRAHFLTGWMPPHPTFFVKREVYEKYGGFKTELKSSADYELLLRLLYVNRVKATYLPEIMVHMRAGGYSNRSFHNRIKAHKEDYKAWKLNNLDPKWFTLALKPMRKIKQYMFRKVR